MLGWLSLGALTDTTGTGTGQPEGFVTAAGVGKVALGTQTAELERRAARTPATRERALKRGRPYVGASEITCELHVQASQILQYSSLRG